MTTTTNLGITLLEQGQAQKEVTINEAFTALDAFINGSVLDKDLATPPGSPTTGVAYIVAASPTGAWVGHATHIAYFNQTWRFVVPQGGARIWVADESATYVFNGTTWAIQNPMTGSAIATALATKNLDNVGRVGIGTTDATNKLSVSGDTVLFASATGDIRTTLNKTATANNALFAFQKGFSTRAEFGLAGNDDFTMKVSPDGTTFNNGLVIDKTSAAVTFPNTPGFTGATAGAAGGKGLVPVPAAGEQAKYLKGDGTWANVTAIALQTARAIGIGGSTGLTATGVNFDGTAAINPALSGTLVVANGGTGATTARAACQNLGAWNILAASAVAAASPADTLENTLATITIPANAMGPNGYVRITSTWNFTNSANLKTMRVSFGGTNYTTTTATTTACASITTIVANRNSASSQISGRASLGADGVSSGTLSSSAVNTTSSVTVLITGQKASGGETLTLESYLVEIYYAA